MKKKLAASVAIILLLPVALAYIFIPKELEVSSIVPVHANASGTFRIIGEEDYWKKGWMGNRPGGFSLVLAAKSFHGMTISLERGEDKLFSSLTILNLGRIDSIGLQWKCNSLTSLNPFRRVQQYFRSVAIKEMMDSVLPVLRSFLEKKENIYGMPIVDSMSRDSTLLVTKFQTLSYPSISEIYRSVHAIRTYIAGQGAREANYPWLHVSQEKDSAFDVIIAIPVDRQLNGNGSILPRHYVPWKIVVGEVRGGAYTSEQAMNRLQQYIGDYQQSPMGLPFQSLVTERDREPDTTHWVTRVVQAVP